MKCARALCIATCAVLGVWAAQDLLGQPPNEEERASVNGKYSGLVKVVPMPEEERRYGKFHDYGFWKGGRWGNHDNLPAGYWVYVAPNWYVWKDSKAAGKLPPYVVKVEPAENAVDVDAARKTISVTFDRAMATEKAWSWMLLRPHGMYPGFRGGPEPKFDETGKTCTLTVALRPETVYAVGVNSHRNFGFRDRNGTPAVNFGWAFATGGYEMKDLPPRVLESSPKLGAEDVDPGLKEVTVTFDRPMRKNTWSWVLQPKRGAFPGTRTGQPSFTEDGLTCKLPVALRPDAVYALSLNTYQHLGFKSQSGTAALPYGLAFKTRK